MNLAPAVTALMRGDAPPAALVALALMALAGILVALVVRMLKGAKE